MVRTKRQLSVIIPAYNEEANIKPLIERLDVSLCRAGIEYEVIVVDDHSQDSTVSECKKMSDVFPVSVQKKDGGRGKAQSLLQGFSRAKYDLVAMLDADLQYPPEALPEMVARIIDGTSDIVVADRDERDTSWVRRVSSAVFRLAFIRLLHGLTCDVQSGMKVFRRAILDQVTLHPSPWAFDLEFLTQARHAGFRIGTVSVFFAERTAGQSKVNVLAVTRELAINAVKVKISGASPRHLAPTGDGMHGAGTTHGGSTWVTHTTLHHSISALQNFVPWQRLPS